MKLEACKAHSWFLGGFDPGTLPIAMINHSWWVVKVRRDLRKSGIYTRSPLCLSRHYSAFFTSSSCSFVLSSILQSKSLAHSSLSFPSTIPSKLVDHQSPAITMRASTILFGLLASVSSFAVAAPTAQPADILGSALGSTLGSVVGSGSGRNLYTLSLLHCELTDSTGNKASSNGNSATGNGNGNGDGNAAGNGNG